MTQETLDPALSQTEHEIGSFLRSALPGDPIAIHETHGGILRIGVTTIEAIGAKGRLTTAAQAAAGGNRWYVTTGRHCFHPKGQSHLILATEAVRRFVADHPGGIMTYRTACLYGTVKPPAG